MTEKKRHRRKKIHKSSPPAMQIGPRVFRKTKEPFMFENLGSLIFTNGIHTLPKEKAHEMGLYGIEVKQDKGFCMITYDEYLEAMHKQGKLSTIVIADAEPEPEEEQQEIEAEIEAEEEANKGERIHSLCLGDAIECILFNNNIHFWQDLEERTVEDLLKIGPIYASHIETIEEQLAKHGRKLKDSINE